MHWKFTDGEKTFEEIVKEWEEFDALGDEQPDIGIEVDELPDEFYK